LKFETRNSKPVTSGCASVHPASGTFSCIVVAQGNECLVQYKFYLHAKTKIINVWLIKK